MRVHPSLCLLSLMLGLTACQPGGVPVTGTSTDSPAEAAPAAPAEPGQAPGAQPAPAQGARWLSGTAGIGDATFQGAAIQGFVLGQSTPLVTGTVAENNTFMIEVPASLAEGALVTLVARKGERTLSGLASVSAVVSAGGGNLTGGTTATMALMRDRLDAYGQAMSPASVGFRVRATSLAQRREAVVAAYERLVKALETAVGAVSAAERDRLWTTLNAVGRGRMSPELAQALMAKNPSVRATFVETADVLKTAIQEAVAAGGRSPDSALLGGLDFGGVTATPVVASRGSGGSSGGSTGGGVTPDDAPSGDPVLTGTAQ